MESTVGISDNQRRWKLAMDLSNMGFYDWYPLENKVIWDENLHRINNLDINSPVIRQEYLMTIVHPEDVELVMKNLQDVLDPDHPDDEFENRFRTILDGQIRFMKTTGVREKNKDGIVDKVFGMVMDTTSKVEAERRIRENEERLRMAADATGFGTFDFLVQEDKLFWDKRMHQMFGLDPGADVDLNEHFFGHIHPEDRERVGRNFGRRMSSESEEVTAYDEFKILVNNTTKYITSHGVIVRDTMNNVIRVTGTLFDITDQKNIEKELRESQEYFRSVFEGNSDHIFTINKDKEIVFINHVAPGLSREMVVGTPLLDLAIPKDREMIDSVVDEVFNSKKHMEYDTTFESPEGLLHYSTRVGPLVENDEVFGATLISRDVTKLKASERVLKNQASELIRSNKNLEQFAYVSSHDIKAPITNLESLINMLDASDIQSEQGKYILEQSKLTIHKMNETIRALNEVFMVQRNLKLPKEEVDIEQNLNSVLELISNNVVESNAEITHDFSEAPSVFYPHIHLTSILQNLITNSIKYRRDNVPLKINIASRKNGDDNHTTIEVTDNGRGLDLERYGKKIFGLFQRFHLDTEGKGMGLNIVKLIIESYGGEITMESEPDKGAKVTINL